MTKTKSISGGKRKQTSEDVGEMMPSGLKPSDLEFVGEWMKRNDVIEFRHGDMVVRRFDAPPAKPVEEQKPSFDMAKQAEDALTDEEKLFGVGAVEWK